MRGLNDHDKRVLPKNVLWHWNYGLICLQETKLQDVELSNVRSIWGKQHVRFAVLKVIGSAGGI